MATLAEYREKYPQYQDLSDEQLADGLHAKFYADMPKEEFYGKIGFSVAPAAETKPRSILQDANTAIEQAADWATFGGFKNYRAAVDTVGAKLGLPGYEKDEDASFKENKERLGAEQEDLNRRRPLVGVASKTVGGVAPALVTMGGSLPTTAARAGTPVAETAAATYAAAKKPASFVARRAADAVKGAQYGAVVGANEAVGDDSFGEMTGKVTKGALTGALIAPVIGGSVEGAARLAPGYKQVLKDESGMVSFGEFDRPKMEVPKRADILAKENLKLAKQADVTPKEMMETARSYEEAGTKPLYAELLKRRGLQRGRNLANMPGKTPDLAEQVIKEEHGAQAGLLRDATQKAFKEGSPQKTEMQLEAMRKGVGGAFDKLFEKAGLRIRPDSVRDINQALYRIPQSVMDEANAKINDKATWNGVDPAKISDARKIWMVKQHIDGVIAKMENTGDTMINDVIPAQKALIDAMEKGVPGYKALNARYSDVKSAQDAVGWGKQVLSSGRAAESADDVALHFNELTPLQKRAAKSGLMGDVMRLIEEASGAPDAPRNAAAFLKGTGPSKLRAVLGEEAEPLLRKIQVLSQGYRNRSFMRPGSGSNTFASQAEAEEMFLQHPPTKQGLTKMADEALGQAWTRVTSPWRESIRDMQGQQLFRRVGSDDIAPIAHELEAQYGRYRAAGRVSRPAGALSGRAPLDRDQRQ